MTTEFIHVGFDNYMALERVLAFGPPTSAPMKRAVQRAKQNERAIDLTSGRRTKTVVRMDDDWVTLLAITPETFQSRVAERTPAAER